jgi:translation initiation factor 2 gamma subunit (eIF-2gamma)
MRVIGAAGHVDHGKSTLVEALTGIDPALFVCNPFHQLLKYRLCRAIAKTGCTNDLSGKALPSFWR